MTAQGYLVYFYSSRSRVGYDTICDARPHSQAVDNYLEQLQDCQLTLQITTSFSCVLCPCSHFTWETYQEATHPKITP